jgi:hypothetical protein
MPTHKEQTSVTVPGEPARSLTDTAGAIMAGDIAPAINPSMAWFGGYTLVPGTTSSADELAELINRNMRVMYPWFHIGPEIAVRFLPGNSEGPPLPKS